MKIEDLEFDIIRHPDTLAPIAVAKVKKYALYGIKHGEEITDEIKQKLLDAILGDDDDEG